jgi:tetratricopeptide (TPR) repeat protein
MIRVTLTRSLLLLTPVVVSVAFVTWFISESWANTSNQAVAPAASERVVAAVESTPVQHPDLAVLTKQLDGLAASQKDLEKRHNDLAVAHAKWEGIKESSLLAINKVGILLNWVSALMTMAGIFVAGAALLTFRAKDQAVKDAVQSAKEQGRLVFAGIQETLDAAIAQGKDRFDELRKTQAADLAELKKKTEKETDDLEDSRRNDKIRLDALEKELDSLRAVARNNYDSLMITIRSFREQSDNFAAVTKVDGLDPTLESFDLSDADVHSVFSDYVAGRYNEAIERATTAIGGDLTHGTDDARQYLLLFRGLSRGRLDQHELAVKDFELVVGLNSAKQYVIAEALYNKAFNLWDGNHKSDAIATMRVAINTFDASNYAYEAARKATGAAAVKRWEASVAGVNEPKWVATYKVLGEPTDSHQTYDVEFDVKTDLISMTSYTFELRPPIASLKAFLDASITSAPINGALVTARCNTGTNLRASVWLKSDFGETIVQGKYVVRLRVSQSVIES